MWCLIYAKREDAASCEVVRDDRQEDTRPEVVCVRIHHSDMLDNFCWEWWMMRCMPWGSRRVSWAFVMKHDIERMVSIVGSRPVICFDIYILEVKIFFFLFFLGEMRNVQWW